MCNPTILKDDILRNELLAIVKEINDVRVTRNIFVHGVWEFNVAYMNKDQIRCHDLPAKQTIGDDNAINGFTFREEKTFAYSDLTALNEKVASIVHRSMALVPRIKSAPIQSCPMP
jgi:hypothetical protein